MRGNGSSKSWKIGKILEDRFPTSMRERGRREIERDREREKLEKDEGS